MNYKKINKEFNKNKSPLKHWWHKNSKYVWRTLLWFIWIPSVWIEKYKDKQYEQLVPDDKTRKKYLDKLIPKFVRRYCETPDCFLISDSGEMGDIEFCDFYWNTKGKIKRFFIKDKQLQDYILNTYEIDGYEKFLIRNWIDWDKAREKFYWYATPYDKDYRVGVVFYRNNIN